MVSLWMHVAFSFKCISHSPYMQKCMWISKKNKQRSTSISNQNWKDAGNLWTLKTKEVYLKRSIITLNPYSCIQPYTQQQWVISMYFYFFFPLLNENEYNDQRKKKKKVICCRNILQWLECSECCDKLLLSSWLITWTRSSMR